MNLMDRRVQEEFFHDYLRSVIPAEGGIGLASSSYDEDWSAMRYLTPLGPLVVRINEIEKDDADVAHRTGFVARLLSQCGDESPEEFIGKSKSLFDGVFADFDAPVKYAGGAGIYAWDSTRKKWPRPFYVRRWIEGPNLAVVPGKRYFRQAGLALRRFHRLAFKEHYGSFKAVAQGKPAKKAEIFALDKAVKPVEGHLPLVVARALARLECDPDNAMPGLVSNGYFGNNILVDNLKRVRVLDWEKAIIGDFSQDFFPLKYWSRVDARSGWYVPDAELYAAFCDGYGAWEYAALSRRPEHLYLEAQWLVQRLGAAARRWQDGRVREPYPEPDFYVARLQELLDV